MATNSETVTTKAKTTPAKRPASKSAATRAASAKPAPVKPRRAARPKSAPARSSSSAKSSRVVPQWLTVGASITGAAVAIGATLFATRNEWLPRARKFGDWVEKSVHDQLGNLDTVKANALNAVKAKTTKKDKLSAPVPAASFAPSGADAGVVMN